MKHFFILIAMTLLMGCQSQNDKGKSEENKTAVQEKIFVELGGEEQYVEMTGASDDLPVLLFLHGGPGWPQTPHLRYFNADLTEEMIVVSWDQAGCGLSYLKNPNPKTLTVESLVDDAHELTQYLKKKFNREKIMLLGFSYGSVIGLQLVDQYPGDYHAYIGVSQIINSKENWDISMQWLWDQARSKQDTAVMKQLTLIDQRDTSVCKNELECFMSKYWLLVDYNGAVMDPEIAKEIAKAEQYYDDYKEYDWFEAFNYTSERLEEKHWSTDLNDITSVDIPVIFMAGREDWNLPGVVAEKFLDRLEAPEKDYIWFDHSGHEPPEEEPDKFNQLVIDIVKEKGS